MTIERNKGEIIFRMPGSTSIDDLQDFADYFLFRTVTKNAQASQKNVDELVKSIKKGRWSKTKERIGL